MDLDEFVLDIHKYPAKMMGSIGSCGGGTDSGPTTPQTYRHQHEWTAFAESIPQRQMQILEEPDLVGVQSISGSLCVLHVAPRRENAVTERLAERGIGAYVPCREVVRIYRSKKVVVQEPVFAEYVFTGFSDAHERFQILDTRDVGRILTVESWDQEHVRSELLAIEAQIALDPRLDVEEWEPGLPVRIKRGPLEGKMGRIVQRRGQQIVMFGVQMLGRAVQATVEIEDVELV